MDCKPGVEHPDGEIVVADDRSCLVGVDVPGEGDVGEPVLLSEELEFHAFPGKIVVENLERRMAGLFVAGDTEGAGKPPPVDAAVLADDRPVRPDHLAEPVHEADGVAAREDHLNPGVDEGADDLDGGGVDPPPPVGDGAVDVRYERFQHCLSPACSTMNAASPSGRFGLSTRRATLLPPLLLRR